MADKPESGAESDDPVERMLIRTGCLQQHYKVQECIAEKKDWRVCQAEVQNFKVCMSKYYTSNSKSLN